MDEKYVFLQPEYYARFKCDGQKCNAYCCKGWNIVIDEKTYRKYRNLKPKSEANQIVSRIRRDKQKKFHVINLDKAGQCPFLTSDSWCSLQKKYGENYLIAVDGATETDASCTVVQGYLETSNINVVDEMVELITITRAYEANQKVLQAEDDMLEQSVTTVGRVQ